MDATATSTRRGDEPEIHEIRLEGHLDDRWSDSVAGLTFTREADGTTTLRGPLPDQAALHGVLKRVRDLGVPIVSVRRMPSGGRDETSMLAIVQDRYGSADVLVPTVIDRPRVGDDEVLVRVQAAGLSAGDRHFMTGEPYLFRLFAGLRRPRSRTRGQDVAGRVEAIGKNVSRFRPGDEVFGTCTGAFAEYASVREDRLVAKPANLTFEQAACAPTSAITALQAIRDVGGLRAGQRALVIGASGGVGSFAVQIAKALGAEVTGVSSTSKLDLVRSIGADRVIDYTREEIGHGGERYDLIIDIAGNRSLSRLRSALSPDGTLVITGGEGSGLWTGMSRQLRAALLSPFIRQTLRFFVAGVSLERLQSVADLMAAGRVRPVVDRAFPLDETADAMRYFESGQARGKIAIRVRRSDH